ncbi:hypothetical protein SCATT_27630 [Streptantibioticus cattleyicolor NRRL 8057 = DSM 46488]|uniref:Uncharacterized protein n=1 Tax=Streptantibioticus cattleyicolor (strain ATCC 35852 / DSM 46488 / JCM 4925 / NBRC 14057 / NRRL 8057) TaxID=1003195 RepID=G8WPF1_STREN|nr:hypothetical protein SCATT_27630 [Streptantibioticus cattleyicolor NRRL 8057 = DSM 46488]
MWAYAAVSPRTWRPASSTASVTHDSGTVFSFSAGWPSFRSLRSAANSAWWTGR